MKTDMFDVWFARMYKHGVDMIRFYFKEECAFCQTNFPVSSGITEVGCIRVFNNITKIHSYLILAAVRKRKSLDK